jgi:DNA polymerase III delta subunit
VILFKETVKPDTFVLSRSIESRRLDTALKLLDQLLKDGEKPERILGGLRYAWERGIANPVETKRRLKLLLGCDIDIKTGRLKPSFALEKLVVGLCAAGKPAH